MKIRDKERDYYKFHKKRYDYCVEKIENNTDKGRIMVLGSKYLHQSVMLSEMGYQVTCYDVPEVNKSKIVEERSRKYEIEVKNIGDLSKGEIGKEKNSNYFDNIMMTEVIEHLAFNPKPMWKSIFRILKPESKIFISTPNSMSLRNRFVEIARIICGVGKGVSISGIMNSPTYSHHWKEYSIKEMRRYFENIGVKKENIRIHTYEYREYNPEKGLRYRVENALRRLGNKTKKMSDEIFLIAKVPKVKPSIDDVDEYV